MENKEFRTAKALAAEIRAAADPELEFLGSIVVLRQKHDMGWTVAYGGSRIPPEVYARAEAAVTALQAKYDLLDE